MHTVHLLQLSGKLKHYVWFWFGPRWSSCVSRSGGGYYGLGVKETWFWKYPKVLPIQALHNLIWDICGSEETVITGPPSFWSSSASCVQ